MIIKLRRKLILYSTGAIFTFLLLIFATINIVNFSVLAHNADEVTSMLASEGGQFLPPNQKDDPQGRPTPGEEGQEGDNPMGPISPETRMSVRYFTVRVDADGAPGMVHLSLTERSVTPEEALSWGASLTGSQKGWTRTYYRFRTYDYEGMTYVSVIDYSRELSPSYRLLWSSIAGGVFGTLVSFLILIPVSKYFVKPLEDSIAKQRRFVADASHELKTPITIISAHNEILEAEHGESDSTKAISRQVGRLTVLVKDLNNLARMDTGQPIQFAPFDLALLAEQSVDSFKRAFENKGVRFEAEIPDVLRYNGDEEGIRRLLTIGLDNALKYAKTFAEFHLYRHSERTCIKFINDAEDLEEGSLDRVFERFYRSPTARGSGIEGSGIGLSIAKEIVQIHKGRIYAKGEDGKFILKIEI